MLRIALKLLGKKTVIKDNNLVLKDLEDDQDA
jgi:hypothetical protein